MLVLAVTVLARAHTGPALAEIEWDDIPHAVKVIAAASAATALYTTLGFPVTFGLLLLGLMVGVERMPILPALAITAVMAIGGYLVLGRLLKTAMPQGIFGF